MLVDWVGGRLLTGFDGIQNGQLDGWSLDQLVAQGTTRETADHGNSESDSSSNSLVLLLLSWSSSLLLLLSLLMLLLLLLLLVIF